MTNTTITDNDTDHIGCALGAVRESAAHMATVLTRICDIVEVMPRDPTQHELRALATGITMFPDSIGGAVDSVDEILGIKTE